jgi:hypothetical protein
LWLRERVGHYFPSRVGVRVPAAAGEQDSFVPLAELLATDLVDPDGPNPHRRAGDRAAE